MAAKIRLGDTVIVIAGKNKGHVGKVNNILRKTHRVIITSINLVKKHVKHISHNGSKGGILSKEAPLHISNVAIYNYNTCKVDKIKITKENNKNVRRFKSDDSIIRQGIY